jgi:hypothetical protein
MTVPAPDRKPGLRPASLALLGFLLVLIGIVGYFVVVLRFGPFLPTVRNDPVPNWLVITAGLALSVLAIFRGHGQGRVVPALLLAVNFLLTTAFGAFLYVMLRVPATSGPAIGSTAADFALADQHGQTRRLADFRGHPLLLVFYRGHW